MFPYWLIFAFFALGSSQEHPKRSAERRAAPVLVFGVLLVALLIGLRYEVGGDWKNYEFMFDYVRRVDLQRAVEVGDPAYQFLNWAAHKLHADMWLVNLTCGAIFAWGLLRFSR